MEEENKTSINYEEMCKQLEIKIAHLQDENYNLKMALNSMNGVIMNPYKRFGE